MTLPRKAFLTVKHKTGLNHSWLFTQESSQISQDYEIFEVRHPKPSPSQPLAQWTLITYFLFKLPSQTIKPLRPGTTILCAFSYLFLVHPTPSSAWRKRCSESIGEWGAFWFKYLTDAKIICERKVLFPLDWSRRRHTKTFCSRLPPSRQSQAH